MKIALIVVDVQNYFMNEHTDWLPAEIANHVQSTPYNLVVLTKFRNKLGSNFTRILEWDKCFNSFETNLAAPLRAIPNPVILEREGKYSAYTRELAELLKQEAITKLFISGVDSDACVLATAFDVFDAGHDFEVIEDLCASTEGEQQNRAAMRIIQRNLSYKKQIDA